MDSVTLSDLIGKRITATRKMPESRTMMVTGVVRALTFDCNNSRVLFLLQVDRARVDGRERRAMVLRLLTINTNTYEVILGAPEEA